MFNPTTSSGTQKWKLSRDMHALRTRFRTFGADLHAQSGDLSAKFLRRSSVGSLLSVRCRLGWVAAAPPPNFNQNQNLIKLVVDVEVSL